MVTRAPNITSNHKSRLNPFAFTSDIDSRFALLIVSVLGASFFIYRTLYYAIPTNSQFAQSLAGACIRAAQQAETQDLKYSVQIHCMTSAYQADALWVLLGVVLLLCTACVIFWVFPYWNIWQEKLVSLTSEDDSELVECLKSLCKEINLPISPRFLWNPLSTGRTALAFGTFGRYYVGLRGGLAILFHTDEAGFRAIMLHELAHLRHADVDKTYFTISIWWAFLGVALTPLLIYEAFRTIFFHSFSIEGVLNVGLRFLALTLLIYLTRNNVLRSREIYADVQASVWEERLGQSGGLSRMLATLPTLQKGHWKTFFKTHPHPEARQFALNDTSKMFHIGFGQAFLTGVTATSAFLDVLEILNNFHVGSVEQQEVLVGVLFALLITGIIGLGLWRATFARQVRGMSFPSVVLVALGLTAGLLLGQFLSFSNYYTNAGFFADTTFLGDPTLSSTERWISLVYFLIGSFILLLILYFFLKWVVAGASAWMGIAAGYTSPRIICWIGLVLSACILGVCFGLLHFMLGYFNPLFTTTTFPTKEYAYSFFLILLPVFPFVFPTLIGLWAYPLSSWLWRKRVVKLSTSCWAFLTHSSQQQTQQDKENNARLRPGLAVCLGLEGGFAFCVLLPIYINALHIKTPDQHIWLAVALQAGIAALMTAWVRRLGTLHGLFAACITGCIATALICLYHGFDFNYFLLLVIGNGALITLPIIIIVSVLAQGVQRFTRSVRMDKKGNTSASALG